MRHVLDIVFLMWPNEPFIANNAIGRPQFLPILIDPKESICQLSCHQLLTALPHFVLNVDSLHVHFGEGVKAGPEWSDILSCPLSDEVEDCTAVLVCALTVIMSDVFVYCILLSLYFYPNNLIAM